MDVLFDTINVRDLLSAGDLSDPTSPLSAPDLRLLIQRLDSHSRGIKSQVQSYLLSHHSDFSSLFSLCSDVVSRTDDIASELGGVLQLISDRPIDVQIGEAVSEIEVKTREAKLKKELLELVRVISRLSERFGGAREALRSGRLRFAAEEIRNLKLAARVCDTEENVAGREPVVYGLLKAQWHECFEEIQEVFSRFVDNAVLFEQQSNRIRVKYQLSVDGIAGVDFQEVLESMEVVGLLDYGLARVADLMIKYVMTPVINSGSAIAFVEESKQESGKLTEAFLRMMQSPDQKIGTVDSEMIFSKIIEVAKFICERICFKSDSWIRSFGRLTWPRISELIIINILSKVVPEDASELADFQKIIELATGLETALKDLRFISSSDKKDERLSNFTENIEVHFASRKKKEILGKSRKLLLSCDFAVPQEYTRKHHSPKGAEISVDPSDHAVDLLFLSEKCLVSEAASGLMKMVHDTLKDVCSSSTRVALELYHAARDAILLYEAIIPVRQERQLDSINQVAVLMHNDFLYLAQEILGLAFQYRPDFPNCIKEHAVFVDLAPRLHLKAEEMLQRQIQLVIFNLKGALDSADGFQNTHQMQQFESAKLSIDQVVFILEKVHIIWEPLLLPSIYHKSMCLVLESVFSRVTRDILFLDDMAAEETLQLQRLIYLMLESLSDLFHSLNAIDQEGKSQDSSLRSLDDFMPSLRKLRKLAELLDMPLRSITAAWESGELVTSCFTLPEIKDFIKAIFTDSPLRKECLWRIENASF
ncbi:centromere/kinetochore protein zw10 homolog isoform X1 [Rhodamnia argentea]|uniref:Centromere/kinetochore protein zw10 homolog isoform X1 n=1 Tax=Rhodamnia argentea TaxID=178133 RepID=A0A8B8PY92_9MYRT|nr:centromere/kinetochore protein zw10 homolog isoform X1 [Rhodamnia argentea]